MNRTLLKPHKNFKKLTLLQLLYLQIIVFPAILFSAPKDQTFRNVKATDTVFSQNLNVSQNTVISGNTTINGNARVDGNTKFGGDTTVDGNVAVNGSTHLAGNLSVSEITAKNIIGDIHGDVYGNVFGNINNTVSAGTVILDSGTTKSPKNKSIEQKNYSQNTSNNCLESNSQTNDLEILTENGAINAYATKEPIYPSLTFSDDQTTGIYHPEIGTISFVTNGTEQLTTNSLGNISIKQFGTTGGVVHNGTDGYLTNSPITSADIAPNTISGSNIANDTITNANISSTADIADTKLATISTSGKVSNSSTTATSANTANTIVLRDNSGNFATNQIELNSIEKNGNSVAWPAAAGAINTYLAIVGPGQLGYAVPAGSGNVRTDASGFTNTHSMIITDTASGATNIKETNIFVNNNDNISGVNKISANTVELDNIKKGTNTIAWPTDAGTTGKVLAVVSPGQLGYTSAGGGSGNVNTNPLGFASSNSMLVTDTTGGATYIKDTGIYFDPATSSLIGNLIGAASQNVLKSGDTMKGPLIMGAGWPGTPSITFTDNTDTGIYNPTGGAVAIATDGLERLSVDILGNVSIKQFGTSAGVVHNTLSGILTNTLVTEADIQPGTITNASIANNTITAGQIANNTITATQIANNTITATQIANNTITATQIANNTITNTQIAAATIANDRLSTVTSGNLANYIVARDASGNFSTNMITLAGTPTNSTDAATVAYVQEQVDAGLVPKEAAVVVSTSDIIITGTKTIDGVHVNVDDRVLLTAQSTANQNGIWLVKDSTWARPADFAAGNNAQGAYLFITSGAEYDGSSWLCETPYAVIGTDAITFIEFSPPSQTTAANIGSGTGLIFKDKTGVTLNLKTLAPLTHMVINNNTNDISLGTDATNLNTTGAIVARDSSGNFSAGTITANLTGNVTGSASLNVLKTGDTMTGNLTVPIVYGNLVGNVTGDLLGTVTGNVIGAASLNVLKAGDTMTGALAMSNNNITGVNTLSATGVLLQAGYATGPSLAFTGDTITGIFHPTTNNIAIATDGVSRFVVGPTGTVSIKQFGTTGGVIHNDASGNLTNSLIVNNDIDANTSIVDTKLATITTSGKVSNSATTATNANTGETIVLRDASGNFYAGNIYANLIGTVTGNVTGNLYGNADSATTAINFSGSVGASGGDITGSQTSMTVNNVGGQSASNIAAATLLANAATKDNTANAIIKRGAAGEFSAGTITASLIGSVTGNVYGNADTATYATTAGSTPILTGQFGASGGDITGYQTSLTVNTVGTKTAAQIAQATDMALTATSNNVAGKLVLRDALGNFTANMITLNTGAILNPTDAVTKAYVDQEIAEGLVIKNPAVVVSTISTNTFGLDYIDSVTVADGNRVLLVGQSNAIYNGLWLAHSGNWERPSDFANGAEATRAYVLITNGATNAGTSWLCSTPIAIIGTNDINFAQFSLPDQVTAANVGSGAGQIFRDKTGITINLKTLAALSHMVINNNTNDVGLGTDATSDNTASTIISRDASGYFSATGMTGAASLNVLKAGDTMSGNLLMGPTGAARKGIQFKDNAGSNYVGLQAPASIGASYTIDLPAAAPSVGQVLQATSASATNWASLSPAPAGTQTYYVSLAGNDDTGNGSFSSPFASVKKAVIAANNLPASLTSPVAINVGPGFFYEDNSGGGIQITAPGISIVGSSLASTVIVAKHVTTDDLFAVTTPNVEFYDLVLRTTTAGSTKSAVKLSTSGYGIARFNSIGVSDFSTAFEVSCAPEGDLPLILFDNLQSIDNGTCISLENAKASINSSLLQGVSTGAPANTGIYVLGAGSEIDVIGSVFRYFDTCIKGTSGIVRVSATNTQSSYNGIICENGCQGYITGLNNVLNYENNVNIWAKDAGTVVFVEGSMLACKDALSNVPTGTAIMATDGAIVNLSATTIESAGVGIYVSGVSGTAINSNGVNLLHCPIDIKQRGAANIAFVGGTIENSGVDFQDASKVSLAAFNSNGATTLSFGNTTNTAHPVYNIQNSTDPALIPHLNYAPNYYGSQGTVYHNPASEQTFAGVQADNNDASYFVVTGKNTNEAKIKLISDSAGESTGENVRGWIITKLGGSTGAGLNADLAFTYTNNDPGVANIGPNTIMQLSAVNNQIQFPVSTNPAGQTAQLVWGSDTNLYRSAADTLKTDDNFVIGTGGILTIPAGLPTGPSIQFAGSTNTGISAATANTLSFDTDGGERMTISPTGTVSIKQFSATGVVHNDATGNLSSSLLVNADIAANAAIVDTKLDTISTPSKVANAATTATNLNTTGAIVARDASGNFSAGTITANLTGNVTGSASLNVLKSGDTMTGNLTVPIVYGNLVGNVTGDVLGTVTGNVIGAASLNVLKAGDTMTGALAMSNNNITGVNTLSATGVLLQTGYATGPSLAFTGDTNTGIYSPDANNIAIATDGVARLVVSPTGTVSIRQFGATGIVHNDAVGNLSTSLLVNADIAANAAIVDTKLDTISTPSKVANSATTATNLNTAEAIVARDASGNFSAGTITANLTGNVTGSASLNVLKAGDTMTGNLTVPIVYGNLVGNVTGDVLGTVTGSVIGAASLNVLKTGDTMTGNLVLPIGSNASPSITFAGNTNTGIYSSTQNTVTISCAGSASAYFDTSRFTTFKPILIYTTGSASAPNISFDGSDFNTGIYYPSNGQIGFSTSGTSKMIVSSSGLTLGSSAALTLPATASPTPSLRFSDSSTTGISSTGGSLSIITTGTERIKISSDGNVSIKQFGTTGGVIHNDVSGNLTNSLIVNNDIDANAAIVDTKLATISTAGKVSNSATTATSENTANTIVARDASGNFSAGMITTTTLSISYLGTTTMTGDLYMSNNNISGVNTLSATTVNATNLGATTMTGNLAMGNNNISGIGTLTTTNLSGTTLVGPLALQQTSFPRISSAIVLSDGGTLDLTTTTTSDIIFVSAANAPRSAYFANTASTYPVGTIKILHNVDTSGYIAFYSHVQDSASHLLGDATAAAGILAGHSQMIVCVSNGTNAYWSAL